MVYKSAHHIYALLVFSMIVGGAVGAALVYINMNAELKAEKSLNAFHEQVEQDLFLDAARCLPKPPDSLTPDAVVPHPTN